MRTHRWLACCFAATLLSWHAATDYAFAAEQAADLKARHRSGQTLLTFTEVDSPVTQPSIAASRLRELRRRWSDPRRDGYRVYRSAQPITSVAGLKPVAELPPLSCWNIDYFGESIRPEDMALRYVVDSGGQPVPPGTGICAYNPPGGGRAYYAVTAVRNGVEVPQLGPGNSLANPVEESQGQGLPVLQRIERPDRFQYIDRPTLHYYVRWESPPNSALQGQPIDYLVGVPPELAKPAPVGIHLHCWGGSLNGGYGWWYQAEQGHLLIASNQVPYDWWTGYHELYWSGPAKRDAWQRGVVRPYTQRRLLSFLEFVGSQWEVDLARTHVAGSSMGGSGAAMFAIRYPQDIAGATSWVGVHSPAKSPTFASSYENVFGDPPWNVKFEDGTLVWDHYDDAWYLRQHPRAEIGLICFSNGKNDGGIGWQQAVEFHRALQETRRPHIFVWGQQGHGQRAQLPVSLSDRYMPLDLRVDQCQPAFTHCDLDQKPGNGDPDDGEAIGQSNLYLHWKTEDIVDRPDRWEMTVGLVPSSPRTECHVDLTPRRVQQFRWPPATVLRWSNTLAGGGEAVQSGSLTVDALGLFTIPQVRVSKTGNRIALQR